jgi:hypothetical protein
MSTKNEFYIAEYYTKKREYGEIFKSSNFAEAVGKAAEYFGESNKKNYLYIGVKGNTELFAICHVDKKYLKITEKQSFRNQDSKKSWIANANKVIKEKCPCIGVFQLTKRAKELILDFNEQNRIQSESGRSIEECLN